MHESDDEQSKRVFTIMKAITRKTILKMSRYT